MVDHTFVTLRLGRVVGPARRQLLAVRRRRGAAPARPARARRARTDRTARRDQRVGCFAISHTVNNINLVNNKLLVVRPYVSKCSLCVTLGPRS